MLHGNGWVMAKSFAKEIKYAFFERMCKCLSVCVRVCAHLHVLIQNDNERDCFCYSTRYRVMVAVGWGNETNKKAQETCR